MLQVPTVRSEEMVRPAGLELSANPDSLDKVIDGDILQLKAESAICFYLRVGCHPKLGPSPLDSLYIDKLCMHPYGTEKRVSARNSRHVDPEDAIAGATAWLRYRSPYSASFGYRS
jgi:hypothetical protein